MLEYLVPLPEDNEKIVRLVPKRNIETWIHYLNNDDSSINEIDVYPKFEKESACKPGVKKLVKFCINGLPNNCLPSLEIACIEWNVL